MLGQFWVLYWPINEWKWWLLIRFWKRITQSISNLMYTFDGLVFRVNLLLGQVGPILSPLLTQKMTELCGFWPLSESNHSIHFKFGVYACWVSVQNSFVSGPRWPNFGPLVLNKLLKLWFLTNIWKTIHTIDFKLDVYICNVCFHIWFAFRPCWPYFVLVVAPKWLKMMVFD